MADRVLVVDDEKLIVKGIRFSLEQDNMQVDCAYDGEEALELARTNTYDIILLDVMLPKLDGFQVCQQIREFSDVPIIMLTAKGDDMDKILGLDNGADDYITKPFKLGVLVSRINALLRRANSFQAADTELQSNGIKVLLLQGQVFKNGELLDLTAAEYKLLCLFMRNTSMVLTKGQILDKLWDCDGNYIDSSTLTVYMRRLRMKIEDNPSEPQMLLTVRGMGYKWNVIK